jgi:large subunit ribosomal protein L13e
MVKHNNVVPNIHCHKKFSQSSRGPLKVRIALNQATRKKARRVKRAAKAAKTSPAPLSKLRPVVHCQTQRYSAKVRFGRGFTLEELSVAGLHPSYAQTVGIAVDHRRTNKSQESLDLNVARLTEYKSKLIILKKKGDAASEAATQFKGVIQPIVKADDAIVMDTVTAEMKDFKAFSTMRAARKENRVAGYRISVANRKKKD